ncbi:MAG: carbonic anhydrase [Deltaproteobacteria bacterium]|nr:carbonic anhydrase [Deltaproteobacteria bacterium]
MSEEALERLLEGNRRYVAYQSALDESEHRRMQLVSAQEPFAAILGCVDSRVPPELIFDQGPGNLFVIRTAGQVLDKAALGSLEFGVEELHIPLIMVLGHQHCGALKAAMEILESHGRAEAEIEFLVQSLAPAVEQGKRMGGDVWECAARAQIELLVARLNHSPILAPAVEAGKLKIVGAWYSLETGLVEVTVR